MQDEVGDASLVWASGSCLQPRTLEQHVGSTGPGHRPSVAAVASSANSVGENRRRYRPLSCTVAHAQCRGGGMNLSSPVRTVNFPCVAEIWIRALQGWRTTVHMHKRSTLVNWWKMGHRYGFWRTKVLLKHPRRATWQEFLPLVGLLLTVALVMVGEPLWWGLVACYGVALGFAGVDRTMRGDGWSALFGVPLCLMMLHTSFTLGMGDGLVRRGRLPSDRS